MKTWLERICLVVEGWSLLLNLQERMSLALNTATSAITPKVPWSARMAGSVPLLVSFSIQEWKIDPECAPEIFIRRLAMNVKV